MLKIVEDAIAGAGKIANVIQKALIPKIGSVVSLAAHHSPDKDPLGRDIRHSAIHRVLESLANRSAVIRDYARHPGTQKTNSAYFGAIRNYDPDKAPVASTLQDVVGVAQMNPHIRGIAFNPAMDYEKWRRTISPVALANVIVPSNDTERLEPARQIAAKPGARYGPSAINGDRPIVSDPKTHVKYVAIQPADSFIAEESLKPGYRDPDYFARMTSAAGKSVMKDLGGRGKVTRNYKKII